MLMTGKSLGLRHSQPREKAEDNGFAGCVLHDGQPSLGCNLGKVRLVDSEADIKKQVFCCVPSWHCKFHISD